MKSPKLIADQINKYCLCKTLSIDQIIKELNNVINYEELIRERPNLFSHTAVYISDEELRHVSKLVSLIESIVSSKQFVNEIKSNAHPIAFRESKAKGLLMGY